MGVGEWGERLRLLALDLVYPAKCGGCERAGVWWCEECRASVALPEERGWRCMICHSYLLNYDGPLACPIGCQSESLTALLSASAFSNRLRKSIHNLKYHGWQVIAPELADLMVAAINVSNAEATPWPAGSTPTLLPVPLHWGRRRYRGFNQAELLAAELSSRLGWPIVTGLVRKFATKHQVGLSGAERSKNVRNAFAWRSQTPPPTPIILVDDVFTTGSTLFECANTLRRAGCGAVYASVLAQREPQEQQDDEIAE